MSLSSGAAEEVPGPEPLGQGHPWHGESITPYSPMVYLRPWPLAPSEGAPSHTDPLLGDPPREHDLWDSSSGDIGACNFGDGFAGGTFTRNSISVTLQIKDLLSEQELSLSHGTHVKESGAMASI